MNQAIDYANMSKVHSTGYNNIQLDNSNMTL